MNTLNFLESKFVSGGLSKIETSLNLFRITATDNGSVALDSSWNGHKFNMIFYPNKVTSLHGEVIFTGTSGSFTHNGYTFSTTPTTGGAIYLLTDPLI